MKKYVMDSFALIAYLEGEESGKSVIPILEDALEGKADIYLSIINWGEIYYIALREGGEERAELYHNTISKYPITIVEANKELTLAAAKFKAHYKMSYADAFAAGLAEMKKATLITGDKEFKPLEKEIKILWI
jgi:predicted nucleic acid-binding protein